LYDIRVINKLHNAGETNLEPITNEMKPVPIILSKEGYNNENCPKDEMKKGRRVYLPVGRQNSTKTSEGRTRYY